jgi:hypothetical protein
VEERYSDEDITAANAIVDSLHEHGVIGGRWFRAYDGEAVLWLVTESDAEKAAVAGQITKIVAAQLLLVALL